MNCNCSRKGHFSPWSWPAAWQLPGFQSHHKTQVFMCCGWNHPSLPRSCPCHGSWGSCSCRSCWRTSPVFQSTWTPPAKSWDILLTQDEYSVSPPERLHSYRALLDRIPPGKFPPGMLRPCWFAHCCCKHNIPVPILCHSTHSQQYLPEGFASVYLSSPRN